MTAKRKTPKPVVQDPVREFARRVSKVMLDLSSSHVYFIVQEAYEEDIANPIMAWEDVAKILKEVQELSQ